MREAIDGMWRVGQAHDIGHLSTGEVDPHILDQRASSRTRDERLGEEQVVFWLVEEDGFVEHWVSDGVHTPRY